MFILFVNKMFLFLGLPVERVTLRLNETDDMNNERTAEQPWDHSFLKFQFQGAFSHDQCM